MKSLHPFRLERRLDLAVRTPQGEPVAYRRLGVPPYLRHRLADLLEQVPVPAPR